MQRRRGFTMVEVMTVTATTAMLVTLAVPSLLRSKMAGNEGSAISSLKIIVTAQEQYRLSFNGGDYGSLDQLSAVPAPKFIEDPLGRGKKSGYRFTLTVGTPGDSTWYAKASPVSVGKTGVRHFFVDASGIIRTRTGAEATSNDTAIE